MMVEKFNNLINRYFMIFLVSPLVMIMLAVNVSAPGVTPSSYIVDFVPDFEDDFVFNFNFDKDSYIETYVSGDLAEYVELDRQNLTGGGKVIAHLKLPDKIDVPGQHRIRVGAKQLPKETGGLEVVGDVGGIIKINVPYSGKHLNGEFYISNANIGEEAEIRLIVKNNGEEDVYVNPVLRIYNLEEDVGSLELEEKLVEKTKSVEYNELLSTENFAAGDYNASAVIEYGSEKLELETGFRLGDFYVEIVNYTKEFERDKVNRFEIDILSFYNGEIENLHANVTILDEDVSFLTPSIRLAPWGAGRLEGFFDTAQIKSSKFEAEIVLNYDGRKTIKVIKLGYAGEIDGVWYFVLGAVFALIFGLIWWFVRNKKWKIKVKKLENLKVKRQGKGENKK